MSILLQIKSQSGDGSKLTEEARLAKQKMLIQKHELDWLRNTKEKYGAQQNGECYFAHFKK